MSGILRNMSMSLARQLSRSLDPRHDYEPQACYNSFCKHWQQAHDIILKSQPQHLYDDVLGVVNHLEQLSTLLVLEARAREINSVSSPAACLEYLLSENLLDKLYEWAVLTGKYENAVRLEELKLFGHLISHYGTQVIAAEPFLRPLLKLLSGFRNELPSPKLESQLVTVLNQLCVTLMQNMKFIDLFFLMTHAHDGSHAEFIVVRLLLSSVHREGSVGAAARDALLLCANMSANNAPLAAYMLAGNTCPVLATGLSGLYSLLPRTLDDSVHRLTADDVNRVNKLTLFIDSLEFCNAVAQVAHPSIKKHLLDLLYQGFLIPVMGPALLQSGHREQMAAMCYLELVLRCVCERGLLRPVLNFLMVYEYDSVTVIDVMLSRLGANSQMSLVSLNLMETLINLNSEDVMLELVFKYLCNGRHLMPSQRHRITNPDSYRDAALAFLSLSPNCCTRSFERAKQWANEMVLNGRKAIEAKRDDTRNQDIALSTLVQDHFNYGNPNESLIGNYHAYLCDARFEIVSRTIACTGWTRKYTCPIPKRETNNNKETKQVDVTKTVQNNSNPVENVNVTNNESEPNSIICITDKEARQTAATTIKEQDNVITINKETRDIEPTITVKELNETNITKEMSEGNTTKEQDSLISICTSEYDTLKTSDSSEKEQHSLTSLTENVDIDIKIDISEVKDLDSLLSIGESSDYESFKYKDGDDDVFAEDIFEKRLKLKRIEEVPVYEEMPAVRNWRASAETIIGPLLSSLLSKAAALLDSEVSVNCRVTSVISKLASFPTPLLTALILCPATLHPNVPDLYQILKKLKVEIDELTSEIDDNIPDIVDKARIYLMNREFSLLHVRAPPTDDSQAHVPPSRRLDSSPFTRVEPKRRSLSTSITNMFSRRLSATPPSHQTQSLHTYHPQSPQKKPVFLQDRYWTQSISHQSILNAVIMDEWIKELAALCEEQALRLATDDENYARVVSL